MGGAGVLCHIVWIGAVLSTAGGLARFSTACGLELGLPQPLSLGCLSHTTPTGCAIGQETNSFTITVNKKSDGLVCDEDQKVPGLPAANVIEARGVNHMEMRNTTNGTGVNGTDEMQRVFNLIWDRTGSVFGVPLRQ